jgi:hypothetical protein
MWFKQETDCEYEFFSVKKLQKEAKENCNKLDLPIPVYNTLSRCYICNTLFTEGDIIDFCSTDTNEYCKHSECSEYNYVRRNLELCNLQMGILHGNIDYDEDTIIPASIEKIYLNPSNTNLDLSQSRLQEIDANNYKPLDLIAFSTVYKLICSKTIVNMNNFINLVKLELYEPMDSIDLTPCIKLKEVLLQDIKHDIIINNPLLNTLTLTNTSNISIIAPILENVYLYNINNIDLTNCPKISHLRLDNSEINLSSNNIKNLNIVDKDIDLIQFPNLELLSVDNHTRISNINNLNTLTKLKKFIFKDILRNQNCIHIFDFTDNTKLEYINMYSVRNRYNIVFSKLAILRECKLDNNCNSVVNLPRQSSLLKFNGCFP